MDECDERAFKTNENIFSNDVDSTIVKEYYNTWDTYDEVVCALLFKLTKYKSYKGNSLS